jgi:hypothetical protein
MAGLVNLKLAVKSINLLVSAKIQKNSAAIDMVYRKMIIDPNHMVFNGTRMPLFHYASLLSYPCLTPAFGIPIFSICHECI